MPGLVLYSCWCGNLKKFGARPVSRCPGGGRLRSNELLAVQTANSEHTQNATTHRQLSSALFSSRRKPSPQACDRAVRAHRGVYHKSSRSPRRVQHVRHAHVASSAQTAVQVAHRTACKGLVGSSVLERGTGHCHGGVRAALVELNRLLLRCVLFLYVEPLFVANR